MSDSMRMLLVLLLVVGVAIALGRPIRRFEARVVERQRIRSLNFAGRAADRILTRSQAALTEALGASPLQNVRLLRSHLMWWWTTYLPQFLRHLGAIAAVIVLTYLGGISVVWRGVKNAPLAWKEHWPLVNSKIASVGGSEATVALRLTMIVLFIYLMWRTVRIAGHHSLPYNPNSQTLKRRPEHYAPVVQLIFHTTRAAESLALMQSGVRTLVEPFSVRAAERAVRSAHVARFAWQSGHRRTLRRHAEKVAGALRAAEYHQHIDPHKALTDITRMLAKITERYAQGRLGALLDEDDEWMRVASPVRGHDLLKMLAVGLIITAISAVALLAGLPDGAAGPLIGTLAPLLIVLVFRSHMPSGDALIDMYRSADRSAG
ncbi:hypothetical protein [Streptomyces virginiae]|uniref:hypothetical protein n=1 Tax=Streptomyces virginiae TaxID=1961 RepID=UPI002255DF90|nr:hypothetical protein [Streptomyces virginiae]MCX5278190.1 hypothetical protein [Streptomyces virginiae]